MLPSRVTQRFKTKIEIQKKDISFFESFLEADILPEAELLFEKNRISIKSKLKSNYILECLGDDSTFILNIKLSNTTIQKASCSCKKKTTCSHLVAALILIRKELSKPKTAKKRIVSNQNFVNQISTDELESFIISRMKADKDFKILIQARFIVEVNGIDYFEDYLNRAFPPTKTAKVTPAHKEVRLFQHVVEELQDQIKDLIGRDNYVDASTILIPLIKKSFYFKNRFIEVPEAFKKSHLLLVDILKTIHSIIEAPSLKAANAKKIIELLTLSYVELIEFKEKELILNLLDYKSNKRAILKVLSDKNLSSTIKSYRQFLLALTFICSSTKDRLTDDIGSTFIEIFNWQQNGHDYIDVLFHIGKMYQLPSRFVEKLLKLKPEGSAQQKMQTELALISIEKHRSYSIFRWVFENQYEHWLISRSNVIEALNQKRDHHTLIKILIHENQQEELFEYLEPLSDIGIYHTHLPKLLDISREKTYQLYCKWTDHYLSMHFGKTALDEFDKQMRKVGATDKKFRSEIDKYASKNFGERPSINL